MSEATENPYRARIEDALRSIITDWPDLENIHIGGGNVTGGGNDQQLPGGTQRMNLIADGRTLLTTLCLLVMDEADLTGPVEQSTPGRAKYLLTHVDVLAGHEIAHEHVSELRTLAGDIRGLVRPSGVRRIPIGACPVDDCAGGVIFARLVGDGTMPDLTCDLDRDHTWSEDGYKRLAVLLDCDGPDRLTVDEVVAHIAERFKRDVPAWVVRGWVRDHPITLAWDGHTLDRVRVTAHYLDRRAKRAAAA